MTYIEVTSCSYIVNTAQKMKFPINDFFSFMRIWSHLLKKSLMENFIFCAVKTLERRIASVSDNRKSKISHKEENVTENKLQV